MTNELLNLLGYVVVTFTTNYAPCYEIGKVSVVTTQSQAVVTNWVPDGNWLTYNVGDASNKPSFELTHPWLPQGLHRVDPDKRYCEITKHVELWVKCGTEVFKVTTRDETMPSHYEWRNVKEEWLELK